MRSQELFYLKQSGKEIRVALDTDGDRIGGLLNEEFPLPVGEDQPTFDYRQHVQNLSTQLGSAIDHAVEAEDQHGTSLIQVSRLRDERNLATDEGFDKLVASGPMWPPAGVAGGVTGRHIGLPLHQPTISASP